MVLSGMSDYSQLLDNTAYMQDFVPLTEEEEGIVARAAEIIQSATAIACTSCNTVWRDVRSRFPYQSISLFITSTASLGKIQFQGLLPELWGQIRESRGLHRLPQM